MTPKKIVHGQNVAVFGLFLAYCWVYLDTNKQFSLQKSTKFLMTPKKFARGQKLSFLRNDPRLPYFMNLM